jgi:DNA-binding NarL/FixJ family response regulator
MPRVLRVAICDDDPLIRALITAWLSDAEDLDVVGEATDGLSARELFDAAMPDLFIMDLDMPRYDGLFGIRAIREVSDIPIVVFSGSSGDVMRDAARSAGATAFVAKGTSPSELLGAIRHLSAAQNLGCSHAS